MRLRKAARKDLPGISELWWEMDSSHLRHDPEFYARKPREVCMKMARKYHRTFLTRAGKFLLVAEQSGEIIGYLAAKIVPLPPVVKVKQAGLVDGICVRRDCRRMGVGKQLLRAALAEFRKRKIRRVRLMVELENGPARKLYQTLAFRDRQVVMIKNL